MRILVVEDDPLVADALQGGLRSAGFAVDRVDSAEKADLAIRSEHFDLILLDLGLPGISGLDWMRRLRARAGQERRTPVLILTRSEEHTLNSSHSQQSRMPSSA